MSERTFRIAAMVSLSLLTIAWFISLPIEPFVAPIENNQNSPRQSVIERVTVPPSWNDILVVWLTVKSPSIQQLSGSLVWTRTTPQGFAISYRLSFMALADGQMHRYIIPVGTHSKWRDAISDVRLSFPPQIEQDISISDIQIIKRSLWALDSLLGWTLAPYLPFDPPWSNLVLLVGVLLASCLAVVCPWYHWQMRLGVAYGFIGITSSVIVIISFISTLNILLHVYGPLDDQTALTHVPSNDSSAQLSPVLIAAATEMPDGPILMVGFDSESDLVYRARALLYPRPVASINLDDTRAIQEVLRQGT